jgi:hypothetical protein
LKPLVKHHGRVLAPDRYLVLPNLVDDRHGGDCRRFVRGCPHDQPAAFFRERRFGFTSASTAGAATLSAAADVLLRFS